jgi:hypothetical protein
VTAAWLGWRDVASRPARALLAFVVVAGCAAAFAFAELNERARDAAVSGEVDRVAAPLRIVSQAPSAPGTAPGLLPPHAEQRARAAAAEAIRDVEPWLELEGDVGGARASILGAPPAAAVAARLAPGHVTLGAALADRLRSSTGAQLPVAGRLRSVTVLPPSGTPDDAKAFVTLEDARRAIGAADGVSELRVRLWPGAAADDVRARLAAALPDATVLRVDRGSVADVDVASAVRAHHLGVAVATAFAALACLAITAFLDASERQLELAALVAIGAAPRHLAVALASRSVVVATCGAAAGTLAAAFAAASLGEAAAVARATVPVVAISTAAAALLGVVASLPTALVAATDDPVRALQDHGTS